MEGINRATLVKIESSTDFPKSSKLIDSKMSATDAKSKKESKKRGVYVEKRVDPEPLVTEEKEETEECALPVCSETKKLPETKSAPSKKPTSFRHLNISGPARTIQHHKPINKIKSKTNKLTEELNLTSSNVSPRMQTKRNPQRNIVEENINQIKTMKFRSTVLKETKLNAIKESKKIVVLKRNTQTPSNHSEVTKVLSISDQVNWSNIFPRDSRTSTGTNRLREYIHKYKADQIDQEHDENNLNENTINIDSPAANDGKDKKIYNFLIDLLDTACDDNVESPDKPTTENVDISVIDEDVARKLYMQETNEFRQKKSCWRKFQNDNPFQQKLQIVDCYNQRTLIPRKIRKPTEINSLEKPKAQSQVVAQQRRKSRKQNLLTLLKRQLSLSCYSYEPESMYQALRILAKRNREYKRNLDYCERKNMQVWQAKGRKKTSTRLPKNKDNPKKFCHFNVSKGKFLSHLTRKESNKLLEVFRGDYD